MIIEIDEKCIELIEKEKYKEFFNNLAYFMNNGRNYIYINKTMLETLYKSDQIDDLAKKRYKNIFDNSFEDFEIISSVNRKVIVVNDKTKEIIREEENIKIPIDIAIKIGLFENRSNLICENHSDCTFFLNMSKFYTKKQLNHAIDIELENCNGGGDTISDVYEEKNKINEISLLLVDSDQKYCSCKKGSTLKNLLKKECENSLVEIYPLYMNEIENLIPINLIESYYEGTRTEEKRTEVINLLKLFISKSLEETPLAYFDMKKGIEIEKWEKDEEYKKYWKNELDRVGFKYDDPENIVNLEQADSKNIVKGFGDKLLTKINAYVTKHLEDKEFINNINEYAMEKWLEIGKLIYSYGCAKPKKFL